MDFSMKSMVKLNDSEAEFFTKIYFDCDATTMTADASQRLTYWLLMAPSATMNC